MPGRARSRACSQNTRTIARTCDAPTGHLSCYRNCDSWADGVSRLPQYFCGTARCDPGPGLRAGIQRHQATVGQESERRLAAEAQGVGEEGVLAATTQERARMSLDLRVRCFQLASISLSKVSRMFIASPLPASGTREPLAVWGRLTFDDSGPWPGRGRAYGQRFEATSLTAWPRRQIKQTSYACCAGSSLMPDRCAGRNMPP